MACVNAESVDGQLPESTPHEKGLKIPRESDSNCKSGEAKTAKNITSKRESIALRSASMMKTHEKGENGDLIHRDIDEWIPTGTCAICAGVEQETEPPEDRFE